MTSDKAKQRKSSSTTLIALLCSGIAVVALVLIFVQGRGAQMEANEVIRAAGQHVSAVPPEALSGRADELALWALNTVHKAVETEDVASKEAKLALIAQGDALLALERGDLDASGLEQSEEGFHEVELLESDVVTTAKTLAVTARWRAVGLVVGAEHRHRIGNTFTADITLSWTGSEWRVTGLDAIKTDPSDIGQVVDAEQ